MPWQKCISYVRIHGSYNFSDLPFMVVHINLNLLIIGLKKRMSKKECQKKKIQEQSHWWENSWGTWPFHFNFKLPFRWTNQNTTYLWISHWNLTFLHNAYRKSLTLWEGHHSHANHLHPHAHIQYFNPVFKSSFHRDVIPLWASTGWWIEIVYRVWTIRRVCNTCLPIRLKCQFNYFKRIHKTI